MTIYVEKKGNYEIRKKQPAEISLMIPEKCQKTVLRLFVKSDDKFSQAKAAFEVFCKSCLDGIPDTGRDLSHS